MPTAKRSATTEGDRFIELSDIVTPCACARGKVISRVVVVAVDTKITKSGDLGT